MKLRAAVIGVGYLGNFHAQKYRDLVAGAFAGKIDFVGVCDLNAEQSKKIASTLGVEAFSNPKDLIGKVDLVTIATVTSSHFETAKMFLENKIHVNVEKPMTVTALEAKALVDLAKKNGVVLCVGHSERFNPAIRAIRSMSVKPKYIELNRHAPFNKRGSDVSVIHDLMIHDIDLAINLDTSPVKVVSAQGGMLLTKTLDWARCELQFASSAQAMISVSRMAGPMTRTVKLVTDKSIIEGNLQTGDVTVATPNVGGEPAVLSETKQTGRGDNLLLETEAYFHAVLGDAAPVVSGEHGLTAMQIVESVMELVGKSK